MAAPGVAGMVVETKSILTDTAESVAVYLIENAPGMGRLDAPKALEKALSITH